MPANVVTSEGYPTGSINQKLQHILESYESAKKDSSVKATVISALQYIRQQLRDSAPVNVRDHFHVKASIGQGTMANVPWIALLDGRETATTSQGVYCVYLFKADMSGVYITFMHAIGRTEGRRPNNEDLAMIEREVEQLRPACQWLSKYSFQVDDGIQLADSGKTGKAYKQSTIAYKYYPYSQLPPDAMFMEDLEHVLKAYDDYLSRRYQDDDLVEHVLPGGTDDGEGTELQPEYSLAQIAEEMGFAEFELEHWVRTTNRKGQAILYGPPGAGKTYLAERLAKHLVGGGDGLYQVVQFHPAFAYEDFVQGIRPKTNAVGGLE